MTPADIDADAVTPKYSLWRCVRKDDGMVVCDSRTVYREAYDLEPLHAKGFTSRSEDEARQKLGAQP